MNRAAKAGNTAATQESPTEAVLQVKLSKLIVALSGAVLASSTLVTGDSVSVSTGETLPQVLLILATIFIASASGWQVLPMTSQRLVPMVLFAIGIGWLLLSTIVASLRADGRAAWNSCWHVIALVLVTLLMTRVAHRAHVARALLQLITAICVFQTIFAMHQYFISMPASRAEYLANPDAALMKAEIQAPPGSELRMQYESRLLGSFEPIGTFALTNSLATLLSGLLVALGSIIWWVQLKRSSFAVWCSRIWWLLVASVWLLTKSRSGFLAVVIVAAVFVLWQMFVKRTSTAVHNDQAIEKKSKLRWALAACVLTILLGGAILGLASDRLVFSEAPKSIQYRLEYWQATSKMILDYPWTGVGLGNFQSHYPAYKLPVASEAIADPHNWIFDLAANCSIPLLIVAIMALGLMIRSARIAIAQASDAEPIAAVGMDRVWANTLWLGALIAFLLVAFLQLILGELIDIDATCLGFLAALGCWWSMRRLQVTERATRQAALLAIITMLVCLLASGSWQSSGMALPMAAWIGICCPKNLPSEPLPWRERSKSSLVGIALSAIALAGFVWQTWQPVQGSWALEQQAIAAWQRGQPDEAIQLVQQAIATDPLAPSSRRLLVQLRMDLAMNAARKASPAEFLGASDQVDSALNDLLARDPVSNLNCSYAGECNLAMAAACHSWNEDQAVQRVIQAASFYEKAIVRYPTSAAWHAQLGVLQAWLDLRASDQLSDSAKQQLEAAENLSQITPHENRKLASQQIFLPPPLSDRFASEAISRPTSGSPWVKAEPLCDFLRKL